MVRFTPRTPPVRCSRGSGRLLGSIVAIGLVTAACGGSEDGSTPDSSAASTTTSIVLTSEGVFRVRPVRSLLSIDNMPIGSFGSDAVDETMISANLDSSIAFDLGPAVADESDIATVAAVAGAAEWTVDVTLTDAATTDLRDLATACLAQGKRCERGRIAVTVDGTVLADITVVDAAIGPTITLSAGLNELQAETIAEALTP